MTGLISQALYSLLLFPQCTNRDHPLIVTDLFHMSILNNDIRISLGQILLDELVQADKRVGPHASLVFGGRIDHPLGGVHQGQQGALKILLMQVSGVV